MTVEAKTHVLKTWPEPFSETAAGRKMHEIRFEDGRSFAPADVLVLREWLPAEQRYTGRWLRADVTYVSRAPAWGLPVKGSTLGPAGAQPMVVMTIKPWMLRLDGPTAPTEDIPLDRWT
jgi:hypothetical protein